MKQQDTKLSFSFSRGLIRELTHRFILTLGITALVALATGVHADIKPKPTWSTHFALIEK